MGVQYRGCIEYWVYRHSCPVLVFRSFAGAPPSLSVLCEGGEIGLCVALTQMLDEKCLFGVSLQPYHAPFFLGQLPGCGMALLICTFCSCAGCTLGKFNPAWQNCSVQILQLPSSCTKFRFLLDSAQFFEDIVGQTSSTGSKLHLNIDRRHPPPVRCWGALLELVVTAPDS